MRFVRRKSLFVLLSEIALYVIVLKTQWICLVKLNLSKVQGALCDILIEIGRVFIP